MPGAGALTLAPHDAVAREAWQQRGGVPATPQELNRYAYARNNPLRFTDPTGHCAGGSVWHNLVSVFDGTCVRKGLFIMSHARTADEWALGAFAAFGPPTAAALLTAGTFGFAAAAPGVVATVGTGAGTATQAVVRDGDPTDEVRSIGQTAQTISRQLTAHELGLHGQVQEFRASITVAGSRATVSVDMIRGEIPSPFGAMDRLSRIARSYGADVLRIEATLANERLYTVLHRRYGLISDGGKDFFEIPLK